MFGLTTTKKLRAAEADRDHWKRRAEEFYAQALDDACTAACLDGPEASKLIRLRTPNEVFRAAVFPPMSMRPFDPTIPLSQMRSVEGSYRRVYGAVPYRWDPDSAPKAGGAR